MKAHPLSDAMRQLLRHMRTTGATIKCRYGFPQYVDGRAGSQWLPPPFSGTVFALTKRGLLQLGRTQPASWTLTDAGRAIPLT